MTGVDASGGHRLAAVRVWLPGPAPVAYRRTIDPAPTAGHWRRIWRCSACGAERDRPEEFTAACPGSLEPVEPAVADD